MRKFFNGILATALVAVLAAGGSALAQNGDLSAGEPDARFILRTARIDGNMGFIGAGGDIDRVIGPTLRVTEGDLVEVVLLNGDGVAHYFVLEDLAVGAPAIEEVGDRTIIRFVAGKSGTFTYSCALQHHWKAGMIGQLVVAPAEAASL